MTICGHVTERRRSPVANRFAAIEAGVSTSTIGQDLITWLSSAFIRLPRSSTFLGQMLDVEAIVAPEMLTQRRRLFLGPASKSSS